MSAMDDALNDILEHHGVKGQKWGVRRDPKTGARPIAVTLDRSRFGQHVHAKDAKRHAKEAAKKSGVKVSKRSNSSSHTPSEDSKKAEESKAKIKSAGGTHTLSNQELQHLANRMNLEQQVTKLSTGTSNAGVKFAKEVLVNVGKQQVTKLASDAATKLIAASLKK